MRKYYILYPLFFAVLVMSGLVLIGEFESGSIIAFLFFKGLALAFGYGSVRSLLFLNKYQLIDKDLTAEEREELRRNRVKEQKQAKELLGAVHKL